MRASGNHTIIPIVLVDTLISGKTTLYFVEGLSERKPLIKLYELSQSYPEWDTYGSDDFEDFQLQMFFDLQ